MRPSSHIRTAVAHKIARHKQILREQFAKDSPELIDARLEETDARDQANPMFWIAGILTYLDEIYERDQARHHELSNYMEGQQ